MRGFTRRGIEDLKVSGRLANPHWARARADLGFHEFGRPLESQSPWYGAPIRVADRWYPSTKRCSGCGYRMETLSLSDRTWTCPPCGTLPHRDEKASRNLEPYAYRELDGNVHECGELAPSGRSTKQESMSIH